MREGYDQKLDAKIKKEDIPVAGIGRKAGEKFEAALDDCPRIGILQDMAWEQNVDFRPFSPKHKDFLQKHPQYHDQLQKRTNEIAKTRPQKQRDLLTERYKIISTLEDNSDNRILADIITAYGFSPKF